MDEIQLLTEHRPLVPSPSPEVTRRAREALMAAIQPTANPTVFDAAESPGQRSRRPLLVAVVVAGAAALIAGAVVVGVSPGSGPGRTESASALESLAQVAGHHRAAGTGTVAHTVSMANWGDGIDHREIWIAPDGSGRIRETRAGRDTDTSYGAGGLSSVNFTGWPTDVSGVLAKLSGEARGTGMRPMDAEAFVRAGDYLRETGAPPEVRAALFGAVAQLHGVQALGSVKDHNGRAGLGFAINSDASHDSRWELIFDPQTSALLGELDGSITHGDRAWAVYTVSELVPVVPAGGTSTLGQK